MAKVQQRSEKITAFGGIFFVLDKFDSILSSVIDSHLGLRSDCMEDLNLYLKDVLTECPHTRVPSADTVLRGIEDLLPARTDADDDSLSADGTSTGQRQPSCTLLPSKRCYHWLL